MAVLFVCLSAAQGAPCVALDTAVKSATKGDTPQEITFDNRAPFDVTVWWVSMDGGELYSNIIGEGDDLPLRSYPGEWAPSVASADSVLDPYNV
jgi:hypothetical protein